MKIRTLLVMLIGAVVLTGVAGVGLLRAYDRAHSVLAQTAVIESDTAVVGTAFSGVIEEVMVQPGATVSEGDELFRLQSPTLQQARETARFNEEGVGYTMIEDDTMIFVATGDGVVGSLPYGVGSFVPANTEITTITLNDSMRVKATMPMTAGSFARLSQGSPVEVTLPGDRVVMTEIYELSFESTDAGTTAVVRTRGEDLASSDTLPVGAPVRASLHLDNDGGLGVWAAEKVGDLLSPRGY